MTVAELIALLQKADPSLRVLVSTLRAELDVDPEFTGTGDNDGGSAFYIEPVDSPEDDS
jgi:hypothetical protein